MLTILFREADEAKFVYGKLLAAIRSVTVEMEGDYSVSITCKQDMSFCLKKVIVPILVDFIIHVKENKWITELLQSTFYYEDKEEQRYIIDIAKDMLNGKYKEVVNRGNMMHRKKVVRRELDNFLSFSLSFSMDSFLQFRLKEYIRYLRFITEYAIDEYKLEYDYQQFVEELRAIVDETPAKRREVHITCDGAFSFYDEQFQVLEVNDVEIENIEMELDNDVLAPLMHLAPRYIHLYTEMINFPLVVTILNIFQERVTLRRLQDFKLHT